MPSTPWERLDAAVRRAAAYTANRGRSGIAHDDADDTVGTIDCDDAAGFDPRRLLAALSSHGARAVVIGQVAGILHGSQELTGDLDLLWSGHSAEAQSFVAAFADVGAAISDDDHEPVALDVDAFARPKVLFRSAAAAGDCCTPKLPWGSLDIVGVLDRACVMEAPGVNVFYASLDDLVAMRLASGRPKDLRRAAELDRLE